MSITRGQQGYYSDQILASVNKVADYYRNIGKTEEEVFSLLTSIGSSPDESALLSQEGSSVQPFVNIEDF